MKPIRKILLLTFPDGTVQPYANAQALWASVDPGISIHAFYKGRSAPITSPTGYKIEQKEVLR
jgi:hypothetical protein